MPRKRDDRPRESAPPRTTGAPGEAQPAPIRCALCAFVYDPDDAEKNAKRYNPAAPEVIKLYYGVEVQVEPDADGALPETVPVCGEERECRRRQLDASINRQLKGDAYRAKTARPWLFLKTPRDLLKQQMDVRPARSSVDARRWLPRFTPEERMVACILYHSLCYPVSMEYAVRIAGTCPRPGRIDRDEDEILRDAHGRPQPLTVTDIGRILGEQWQGNNGNASRTLKRLRERGAVRVDEDGRIFPMVRLEDLTLEQREALYGIQVAVDDPSLSDEVRLARAEFARRLRGVPKTYRAEVEAIWERCPDDNVRTEVLAGIWDACSDFGKSLNKARTDRNSAIRDLCSRGTNLIPDWERGNRSSSPRPPRNSEGSQRAAQPDDEDKAAVLNELYEQGAGKGAYALLPPVADRPRWLVANALSKIVGKEPGERAVTSLIQACETVAGEKLTGSEIVCAIGRKARVIARPSVDNREGYALTVVPQEFEKGGLAGIRDEIRQRREERARAGAIASDASLRMLIAMEVESRLENEWAAMGEAGQFKAIDKARRELAAEHRWPRPQGSFEPLTADQKRWSEYSDAQRTKLATGRVKAALRDATAKQFEAEIVGRDRAALAAELQAKFYGDAEASAATES